MDIGLGLDGRLGLTTAQLRDLAPEAKQLGYTSLWTPYGGNQYDPLVLCAMWHAASGLRTGVSVVSLPQPDTLALEAATVGELTGGTFVLGLGSGRIRDRVITETSERTKKVKALIGERPVPIYLAALGPQMLKLAGRVADGVLLNWCTAEHVRWSRERVGREIPLVSYIRVCVDDDLAAARHTLAVQVVGYALAAPPGKSYRGHFERMGFAPEIERLAKKKEAGASVDMLADEVPIELLDRVGYAGPAQGARAAFLRLAGDLDVAIVRILSARTGSVDAVRSSMTTFAPGSEPIVAVL